MADIRHKRIAEFIAPFRVTPGKRVVLARDFDPAFKAGIARKKDGEELLRHGVELLAEYQDKLAAQDTYGGGDSDMFATLTKGHGALAAQPGGELFVGADQPIRAHRQHDGTQFVEDFIGALRLGLDGWIQTNECFAQVLFNEDIVDAPR